MKKEIHYLTLTERDDWCMLVRSVFGDFLDEFTMDFLRWEFQNWYSRGHHIIGLYLDEILVSSAILKFVDDANFAFVRYLVVSSDRRGQGLGTEIVTHLCKVAKDQGLHKLWYVTTRTNEASLGLSRKIGFLEINNAGFVKFVHPYPQIEFVRDSVFEPVSPEKLSEILLYHPELIPTETLPAPDEDFEACSSEGLQRLGKVGQFSVLCDDLGAVKLLLYYQQDERDDAKWRWITVFALAKDALKEAIIHQFRELEDSGCESGFFSFGPRAKVWIKEINELQVDLEELVLLEKVL